MPDRIAAEPSKLSSYVCHSVILELASNHNHVSWLDARTPSLLNPCLGTQVVSEDLMRTQSNRWSKMASPGLDLAHIGTQLLDKSSPQKSIVKD